MIIFFRVTIITLSLSLGGFAAADGNWSLRVGVHLVEPDSDNGGLVDVGSSASPTFDLSYRMNPNWYLEILAAVPFSHDVSLIGGDKVADVDHLPPTVSLQYHFRPNGTFRPFVGLGANATVFFDEQTNGALSGTALELEPSFGLAASMGADIALGNNWFANTVVRYIDIETDAILDGVKIGTVRIDPIVYGLNLGWRFK